MTTTPSNMPREGAPSKADRVAGARQYIHNFKRFVMPGIDWVETNDGTRIYLNKMTDDEALMIAAQFVLMEQQAATRRQQGKDN